MEMDFELEKYIHTENRNAMFKLFVIVSAVVAMLGLFYVYVSQDYLDYSASDVSVSDSGLNTVDVVGIIDTYEIVERVRTEFARTFYTDQLSVNNTLKVSEKISGTATLEPGSQIVEVAFHTPFEEPPIVMLTPVGYLGNYTLRLVTTAGFQIEIDAVLAEPIQFNWLVLNK